MVGLLKVHFHSEDQQYRMLYEWQSCSSSSMLEKHPGESQKTVFEKMLNCLRACQGQMNSVYHDDRILRDQLMIAIDIPDINRSLRERMPLISEDLIQRTVTSLSIMPGSARSLLAATGLTAQHSDGIEQEFSSLPTVAFYGTGRRFGGD